jgi:hypothetical protein
MLDRDGDGQIDGILAAQGTNCSANQLRFFNVDGSGRTIWTGFPGVWNVAALGLPAIELLPAQASSLSADEESEAAAGAEEQFDQFFAQADFDQTQAAATLDVTGATRRLSKVAVRISQQPVSDRVRWESRLDAAIAELASDNTRFGKRRAFGRS